MSDDAPPTVHLSIGEVLSLVQEEFPDVTISKIRFLESQGLIAPERTASGYRKFYDADIDRLRWILRQQRDHFLPLKVIKKMLDEGSDPESGAPQQQLFDSPAAEPQSSAPSDTTEGAGEGAGVPAQSQIARSPAHPAVAAAARGSRSNAAENDPVDAADNPRPAPTTPADIVAALQEDPRGRRRSPAKADRAKPSRSMADNSAGHALLSREELLESAGIDEDFLSSLEQFGLIVATTTGATSSYDHDAVEIASAAARYAALGLEARHLRMYKVAAEREAGMIEQLIIPLVRQRNPEAAKQAIERCDELAELGSQLHQTLLRRYLGPLLGP